MSEEKILTPIKAIRANCIICMCGQVNEVKLCPCTDCPLYPYRMGKNPNRKGKPMTDEQRTEVAERLRLSRQAKNDSVNATKNCTTATKR